MLPDAGGAGATFEAVLKRLSRRMWFGALLYALAGGLAIAAVLHGSGRGERAWFWNAAATALIAQRLARHRKRPAVAALLERALPDSRNTIVTAEELLRHPDRASERVRDAVVTRAAQLAAPVSPGNVYSLVRPFAVFVAMMALVLTAGQDPARIAGVTEGVRAAVGLPAGVPRLAIAIEPPAYTRLPRVNLVDPERIDALEGSRAVVTIGRDSTRWRLRFGERTIAWDSNGAASLTLNESGYFALEPVAAGDAGSRLVAVAVTPDRAPVVTIDTPARDLVVPNALRDIPVAVSAADDLALASLELRYTKVSGTGEDFEFVEGALPITLARTSDKEWKARATIALTALQLEPGDSLVYRAVAKDGRPGGAGEGSSDTFFVEVAGPGQVALEGFELPPDQERYALSQQMIVLKIERLRAREQAMGTEAVKEATNAIAAEQRAVRANFIFLMGGHVEDEEVEAEQSSEIQEGRLENSARREISTAVHLMTRAEQGLMAVNTGAALPPAKSAVEALQRAFGRNRYILRTPPSRSEIDPSRRLSGTLSAADTWRRDPRAPERDPKRMRLDGFVGAALAVASQLEQGAAVERGTYTALAERALAIDPGAREWQQVAARLTELASASAAGRAPSDRLAALNESVKPALEAALAASRAAAPKSAARPGPLGRAWTEERRR